MADASSKIVSLNVLSTYDKKRDALNDDKFVAQEQNKSLMSQTEHDKLDDIESNAQVNLIESVSVDGNALTIDSNKNVNIDLSGKVNVETGKSLVSTTDIAQITTNKNAIATLNGDVNTAGSVDKKINDAIGGITGFEYSIVSTLPSTGAKGIIYLVPNSGSGENIYDEYIWVNSTFEKIGTTEVNLDGVEIEGEVMTLAQYNALTSIDPDKNYYITDGEVLSGVTVTNEVAKNSTSVVTSGGVDSELDNFYALNVKDYIVIPAGADLDTYKTPGVYRCGSTTNIQTISNLPYESVFKLVVEHTHGTDRYKQTFHSSSNGTVYYRSTTSDGNYSSYWREVQTDSNFKSTLLGHIDSFTYTYAQVSVSSESTSALLSPTNSLPTGAKVIGVTGVSGGVLPVRYFNGINGQISIRNTTSAAVSVTPSMTVTIIV